MSTATGSKTRCWPRSEDDVAPRALHFVPHCLHRIKGPGSLAPTGRPKRAAPPQKRGRLVLSEQEMLKSRKCRARWDLRQDAEGGFSSTEASQGLKGTTCVRFTFAPATLALRRKTWPGTLSWGLHPDTHCWVSARHCSWSARLTNAGLCLGPGLLRSLGSPPQEPSTEKRPALCALRVTNGSSYQSHFLKIGYSPDCPEAKFYFVSS